MNAPKVPVETLSPETLQEITPEKSKIPDFVNDFVKKISNKFNSIIDDIQDKRKYSKMLKMALSEDKNTQLELLKTFWKDTPHDILRILINSEDKDVQLEIVIDFWNNLNRFAKFDLINSPHEEIPYQILLTKSFWEFDSVHLWKFARYESEDIQLLLIRKLKISGYIPGNVVSFLQSSKFEKVRKKTENLQPQEKKADK